MAVTQIEGVDDGGEVELGGARLGGNGGDEVVADGVPHKVFPETALLRNGILGDRIDGDGVGGVTLIVFAVDALVGLGER